MGPTVSIDKTPVLEHDLERELRAFFARRLAEESTLSELIHVVLVVVVAFIAWPWVAHLQVLLVVNAVWVSAFGRAFYRRRASSRDPESPAVVHAVRKGVLALGLAWGAGILSMGPYLPMESLAWLAVIFAGAVSIATLSLLPDKVSFHVLLVLLLGSVAGAIAMNKQPGSHGLGIALVAMFAVLMVSYFGRAHAALTNQFRVAKRLELTERAASEARVAAQRLGRVIEATSDHVSIAGPDGGMRYLNRAGREMVGIGPDEDISRLTVLDLLPPRLRDQAITQMALAAQEGSWKGETALQHRDGHEVPVSVVALVQKDADGNVESQSAIARDVSDQVAVRVALQAAHDSAQQATAAKSAFLANTSHEIRTPLNGILGMVELLLDTELTPEQRRSAELIATSGDTLLNTINDVLDLSKIEAGQLDLEIVSFDLHQVVHSSVRLFMLKAHDGDIELVSDVGGDVPRWVTGDPHRMRQALSNLIGNAVKFTKAGEVVVSVRVLSTAAEGVNRVRFSVRDSGIGIKPEHLERIFEPFKQVDVSTTRHYGGTGLGLSISRSLVQMMGGSLKITSDLGKGSDFYFDIDLVASREPHPHESPERVDLRDLRGRRVLVVDDHPLNRRVLVEMLQWAGCEVESADGASAALETLEQAGRTRQPFHLMVSDVQMPDRDGFSLAVDVRASVDLRETRIMMLSSGNQRGDSERCRTLGVAAYLQKPASRAELLEAAAASLTDAGAPHRASLITRATIERARRTLRVLLAEDNPVNQIVASSMLRKRGHHVTIVENGQLAVNALDAGAEFDVVLMDVHMPELDGVQATRLIRQRHPSGPPIIALTANVSTEEQERCLAAGMSGYLTKPFKPHELFAMIEGRTSRETPAVAVAVADDAVDVRAFRAMLAEAGIEDAADTMLRVFLEDSAARMTALSGSLQRGDAAAIEQDAHGLKSGAGSIRAQPLAALLQAVEIAGAKGDVAGAQGLQTQVESAYARVVMFLEESLGAPHA